MEEKRHYKMYKSGKSWLIAAITTVALLMGGFVKTPWVENTSSSITVAHADTNENWMQDTNLQKAVLNELRSEKIVPSSASTFTQNDLVKMQTLSINTNQPNDLEGLQYATSLNSLTIANNNSNNGISSLAPLANLTNLKKLELDNNKISDLTPLAKLTSLTELHLNNNNISDIQPLSSLTNLTHLELGNNKISDSDTSPLKSLTNLSYLNISGNRSLTNLNNLSNLTSLTELQASDLPNLTDISGIKNSSHLNTVGMARDAISDISVFKGFTGLKSVILDTNHISDLSPLNGSFKGHISSPETLLAHAQTVPLSSAPIDYTGQKVTVSNGAWSVNNDSYTYRFDSNASLPDPVNKQSISASDYTTYVGAAKPTATDFKATATDKDGNNSSVNVDLSKADLTKAGVYDVIITSADGQSKTVKLTVKDNSSSSTSSTPTPQPVQRGTVVSHYVDQNGNKIAPDETQTGNVGDGYSTTQKSINGYTFNKVTGNATGTYTNGTIEITYVYSESNTEPNPGDGKVAVKGAAVYAIKKIGLYKNPNFKNDNRIKWYLKEKRVNRPEFIVKGYYRNKQGTLRYRVQQYNPYTRKYVKGTNGYITTDSKYVVPAYYSSLPKGKRVIVINHSGVNSYKNISLTKKVKNLKKGTRLQVKKVVKFKYATRYVLTNGQYVTANKKFVIASNY